MRFGKLAPTPDDPRQSDDGGGEPRDHPDNQDPRRGSRRDHNDAHDGDGQPAYPTRRAQTAVVRRVGSTPQLVTRCDPRGELDGSAYSHQVCDVVECCVPVESRDLGPNN
jgi:hypothetical protein